MDTVMTLVSTPHRCVTVNNTGSWQGPWCRIHRKEQGTDRKWLAESELTEQACWAQNRAFPSCADRENPPQHRDRLLRPDHFWGKGRNCSGLCPGLTPHALDFPNFPSTRVGLPGPH